MKVIAQRIWNEPAVCIGLLASVILLVINLIGENDWGFEEIIAILAPLASALGIRQAVYSPATVDKLTEPKGTTFQKVK
jgi:hypothetical protein